jgi:hypothetical protein
LAFIYANRRISEQNTSIKKTTKKKRRVEITNKYTLKEQRSVIKAILERKKTREVKLDEKKPDSKILYLRKDNKIREKRSRNKEYNPWAGNQSKHYD